MIAVVMELWRAKIVVSPSELEKREFKCGDKICLPDGRNYRILIVDFGGSYLLGRPDGAIDWALHLFYYGKASWNRGLCRSN